MNQVETRPSLLLRLRDRQDSEAWDQFVDTYSPPVFRYLRSQGLQATDAADLLQEVFLKVMRHIGGFEYDRRRARFSSWLRTVIDSQVRTFWRKRKTQPRPRGGPEAVDDLIRPQSMSTGAASWEEDVARAHLSSAFRQLQGRFKESTLDAFRRTVCGHEPDDKVAHDLNMSVGALYVAKHRVRLALEELLKDMSLDG